jgi:hypothetical protein
MDTRIVITGKDIQKITGKCQQRSSQMISYVRLILGKPRPMLITFDDFCTVYGIKREEIAQAISGKQMKIDI